MTTIRVNGKVRKLCLVNNGMDFLWEVIGNSLSEGVELGVDVDFEMTEQAFEWWRRWARREQLIIDEVTRLGEVAEAIVCGLAARYSDFDELQAAEMEALGISDS